MSWSPEEDAALRTYWEAGTFVKVISRRLKKSEGAINGRVEKLGLPSRHATGIHKRRYITVRPPDEVREWAEKEAFDLGLSLARFIRHLLEKAMKDAKEKGNSHAVLPERSRPLHDPLV